ncbi:two-component system sensor with a ligand-binding domain protein [Psychroserpens burtonensis]|uniref:Two-component system sensor with a ligand-binding domain protein n=1 Tax=Psychroserpens burtonensis TaxID=49278 RepID=A0A5C7BCA0_9FLAO|nr:two-component system sensor with a ligand-binding domain protein [Psychroserpens burtonensis]
MQIGLLLVCYNVYAQNPSQVDVLTTDQGLLFRDVRAIAQDSSGHMWFGTSQGLNRYDGYQFKTYNSDKKNPNFIEEEHFTAEMVINGAEDALWFMANDRLFNLHLSTDLTKEYNEAQNIKGKVLRLLKTADNGIWIITDDFWKNQSQDSKQYLQKFEDGNFKVMASIPRTNRGFSRLLQDAEGFLWWSTPNGNLKFNTEGKLEASYDLGNYEWFGSEMHFVTSFFDHKNTHYYFPHLGGIKVFDEQSQISKQVLDVDNEFAYAIEDKQNHVWFAGHQTLYRMSPKGDFTDYTEILKARFDFTQINRLFIDANNLLWVATDNGLFKIRTGEQMFNNLLNSNKNGWGNTMRGIFEDSQGFIYALCESEGQLLYQNLNGKLDTLKLFTADNSKIELNYAASFFVTNKDKNVVFTVGKTMYKINLETGETKCYNQFIPKLKVYGPNPMIRLSDGRLLFGYTLARLTMFNPETEESELVFKDPSIFSEISDLTYFFQDDENNTVWVGTQNDGLLKININGTIEQRYSINTKPNISKNRILVLEGDTDGSLWIGTYGGGLNHLSADGQTNIVYTRAEGLADNNVVGIMRDELSNLWISTYNGISNMDKQSGHFQNFYAEDGLSHNEFNYSSSFKDSKNNYYFGGMNGLNSFKPEQIFKTSEQSHLRFTGISRYNSKLKSRFNSDYSYLENKKLEISPYDQYFEINWTMPSYFQNNKNTYSTKLEGFEDQWFYQGNSASIRYNQLPAGDYVLKVKGKDSRGNEATSILSIPITVRQIFYKKWWFIVLVLLLIIGIMYSIFRYRFQQALAMERLRTKISSDLHDDVGSLLSGLAMQTELMEINASEADKFKLQKIAGISRNAISQMRDLVWSIDSRRETIEDLIERMHELAEELLLPKNISFQIDNSTIKNPNKKLPAQTKQNIFLIYKESITNVLRHSDATNVTIVISNQATGCQLFIQDNGSKKECYKSTGLGLSNMEMRAKHIKGSLSFQKENGFGVLLNLPFQL